MKKFFCIFFVIYLLPQMSLACTCLRLENENDWFLSFLERSDLVVIGNMTKISHHPEYERLLIGHVKIEKTLKSENEEQIEDIIIKKDYLTSCDKHVAEGNQVILFLIKKENDVYRWPNRCLGSRQLDNEQNKAFAKKIEELAKHNRIP